MVLSGLLCVDVTYLLTLLSRPVIINSKVIYRTLLEISVL